MFCNCFLAKVRNAITKTKHKTAERQNCIQKTVYAVNPAVLFPSGHYIKWSGENSRCNTD